MLAERKAEAGAVMTHAAAMLNTKRQRTQIWSPQNLQNSNDMQSTQVD